MGCFTGRVPQIEVIRLPMILNAEFQPLPVVWQARSNSRFAIRNLQAAESENYRLPQAAVGSGMNPLGRVSPNVFKIGSGGVYEVMISSRDVPQPGGLDGMDGGSLG